MSQQISLYIDVQNRQLVRGDSVAIPVSLPDVYQGDTVALYLEFLNATGSTTDPYTDIDYSDATVIVAVGTIGAQPTAGEFTITDPAATQTTGNIAFNASAATVQAAIQAALTTHWSTATVTGNAGGPYTITNGSNGAQTALLGSSVNLVPVSSVSIGTVQDGTSELPQIQFVEVVQNPIALQDTWTPYPAPTAIVTELQAGSGTQNEIQQITLGNNPYSGAFNVNFGGQTSAPIQWNASAGAVQTALQAMSSIGSGNVSVGGQAGAWVVTFTGSKALASQALMTTVATGLVGPLALTGNLSLNTAGIEEAIGESASTDQTFAIRVTPSGGSPFTCLQEGITIYNDLIVGAPSVPAPGVAYFTETESDARYFQITNNLSEGTAATMRSNLGLGTAATQNTSAFLQPSNNLSDVANASTARTHLGLGTAATQSTSAFLQPSNNLSDVSNASTARTNLGLAIGSNVQAHSSTLDTLAAGSPLTAGTNITITGTWPALTVAASGGGGGNVKVTWVTANTTATAGQFIAPDNTSSGPYTITLPSSPNDGDTVIVADLSYGINNLRGFATVNTTVSSGGHYIAQGGGVVTSVTLNQNGTYSQFTFNYNNYVWSMSTFAFDSTPVALGGTGQTSLTAYAPLVGGTTSTGALQQATSGISTAGYVLTSNGSSSVPSFKPLVGAWAVSGTPTNTSATAGWLEITVGGTTSWLPYYQ